MRSRHDRTRNRGPETLLPVNELVFQDGTVVADHIKRRASVVIFVADTPAAAVIEPLVSEHSLVVPIQEALSVCDLRLCTSRPRAARRNVLARDMMTENGLRQ